MAAFGHLQIYNPRERMLVGLADLALAAATAGPRLFRRDGGGDPPARILVLRLERIGDLLMALGALELIRTRVPGADVHLVLGGWNAPLAPLISGVTSWETLDAPWLARGTSGDTPATLIRRARRWRARGFDLALNFEPDIRSNVLLGMSGAPRRVGFGSAGGGSALTTAIDYDPHQHTADNLRRLVDVALPSGPMAAAEAAPPLLRIPEAARAAAHALLGPARTAGPLAGLHVSGGRPIKQWPVDRFATVAVRLARERGATVVLTGAADDRPLVARLREALPPDVPVIDATGHGDLPLLGGMLELLDVFVTGDTGPMHFAAAVGTPLVAIFGPSDPMRYGPLSTAARVLTADLWCRPCNRVRRPPARCTGRTPSCLHGVDTDAVIAAALAVLDAGRTARR